ncbi:Hypothetical predicted protein, partial [Paramuricea clavata]
VFSDWYDRGYVSADMIVDETNPRSSSVQDIDRIEQTLIRYYVVLKPDAYLKNLIEKVESVTKRMRWKANFFLKGSTTQNQSNLFGLSSNKSPPSIPLLKPFEDDLIKLIENLQFNKKIRKRITHFKNRPEKSDSNSPILDGNLDQLAMLACCSSPHVVKRALDALLNEMFLSISDSTRIRCGNILQAEKILRASFQQYMKVDHFKAKSHRMTTYAWLITLVLLKCSKQDFIEIQPEMREFDRILDALQNDRNTADEILFDTVLMLPGKVLNELFSRVEKKTQENRYASASKGVKTF